MRPLADFTVRPTDTIRIAMEQIERNKHRAVIVVDEEGIVLGTVSDGDIRRALLQNVLDMSPVSKIMNLNCITSQERDHRVLAQLVRRERVTVLPIVDDARKLVDVFAAYEPISEIQATAS